MSKFCTYCGREVPDDTSFCPGCGTKFEQNQTYQGEPRQYIPQDAFPPRTSPVQPTSYYVPKRKIAGRGFGITSMVLGIIACVFVYSYIFKVFSGGWVRAASLGIDGILSGLSLTFALLARGKGYKKQATAGLVLGIIACAIVVITIIVLAPMGHITNSSNIHLYY